MWRRCEERGAAGREMKPTRRAGSQAGEGLIRETSMASDADQQARVQDARRNRIRSVTDAGMTTPHRIEPA